MDVIIWSVFGGAFPCCFFGAQVNLIAVPGHLGYDMRLIRLRALRFRFFAVDYAALGLEVGAPNGYYKALGSIGFYWGFQGSRKPEP